MLLVASMLHHSIDAGANWHPHGDARAMELALQVAPVPLSSREPPLHQMKLAGMREALCPHKHGIGGKGKLGAGHGRVLGGE